MKTCPSCDSPVTKSTNSICTVCGYTFEKSSISIHRKILWGLIFANLIFIAICFAAPQKMTNLLTKMKLDRAEQKGQGFFKVSQTDKVSNPYDQFLKQYEMRPDVKIVRSFELTFDLYNRYLKIAGLKDDFSMGTLSQSNEQIKVLVLKNKKPIKTIQLPFDMSFGQAMEGLSSCLKVMADNSAPLRAKNELSYGSYDSGKYQASLNNLYEMDPRRVVEGLVLLEELIHSIGPDPKLILAAARGYTFLQMVLYPDKMGHSEDFSARALSLLALSNHLSPDTPSLREEALIAMNMGYTAHAQKLIERISVLSDGGHDGIIEAYLNKDISRLNELKGEGSRAMGYYFLTRLYRENGLFREAEKNSADLLLRLKDHYPSVVEMIYSADFRIARTLTMLYPLHILLCMEYEVGSKDLDHIETIEERLKIFSGESSVGGKTSFNKFEALLSEWQPLNDDLNTGFLIDSSQIKIVYRALYSGAIYLRHNLLLNRLSSMDSAQNYVKAMFSGNETHPLAMSMLADVWSSLGKYDQAKALCEQIVNHPQAKSNLAMKAYFCVDDIQFKLKIAPGVFKKLDSNPANQRRMGNLFQWLHNYDMAENFYKTSLHKDPYAFSTYFRLAKVTGDSEPVSKGLDKYSHNYSFLEKAGDYYKEFKDTNLKQKALDCYDKALNQAPSRQSLWRKKAVLLKELGKYEKAQQTINTWLEQYGTNNLTTTMMRAQLANLLLKMEKPEQALKILENDLESYQAGVMMTLARIYNDLDRKGVKKLERQRYRSFHFVSLRYPTIKWHDVHGVV